MEATHINLLSSSIVTYRHILYMAMGQDPGTTVNTQKAFKKDNSGVVTIPKKGTLGFDPQPYNHMGAPLAHAEQRMFGEQSMHDSGYSIIHGNKKNTLCHLLWIQYVKVLHFGRRGQILGGQTGCTHDGTFF